MLASTRARLSQVNAQLAASEKRAAAASAALSKNVTAFQVFRSAGSNLLAFLGGPWGIAFTAAAAGVTYLTTRQDEASSAAEKHVAAQKKLQEQMQEATTAATKQGAALSELERINFAARQKKEMAEYKEQAKAVAEALRDIYHEYAQAENYELFVQGLDDLAAQYAQLKNIFQAFSEGSLSAEQLKQAIEELRGETVKAHGENNVLVRSLDDLLNTRGGVVSGLADMASRMLGLGDAAATAANKVQIAKSVMASPWVLNTGKAEEAIADIEKAIREMQAKRKGIGYAKEMVNLLPNVEPEKISKAISAYQSSGLEGFIRELGDAFHNLNGEQQKNLILLTDASVAYKKESDALKKWRDSQKDDGKSAAVSQAEYTGELERTRQAIDTLQQQLEMDKTEDLARAKIRIEQQYQATLSKTNEELAKQVAQGKLTRGQADILQAEKNKAAELQKQVSLRDAEQKAQERQYKDLQTAADFFRELGDLSGEYGKSLEYQNKVLEHEASIYRDTLPAAMQPYVNEWLRLKQLQNSREGWDGARRAVQSFYSDATNYGAGFESATSNLLNNLGNTFELTTDGMRVNWESTMYGMYNDFLNIFMRRVVASIADSGMGWLGSLLNLGGGAATASVMDNPISSGWANSFIGRNSFAAGGVFFGGDLSSYRTSIVSSPTFFTHDRHISRYAKGAGLMGEAGPEAVMPLVRTSGGNLGVRAETGTSPQNINITVELENRSGQQLQASQGTPRFDGRKWVVGVVIDAYQNNEMNMRNVLNMR